MQYGGVDAQDIKKSLNISKEDEMQDCAALIHGAQV